MRAAQKVVWSEGLLMAPQHLQQQDRYHEALLADRLEAVDPFCWGVLSVELDLKALATGRIALFHFAGVLPDGAVLQFDASHKEAPESRPIEGHFAPTQGCLELFLCLPVEREGVDNFSEQGAAPPRYAMDQRQVQDLTAGGEQAEVPFARRRPVLRFGDERRDDFVSLKVLEVVRDDGGGLVVSEPYVPPCLRVDSSAFLKAGLRRLLSAMMARHKSLSDARREAGESSVEFSAKDVTRYLLLSAINTYIPVLSHIIDSGDISPRRCYLSLIQFAGQLTTFSTTIAPSDLPKFSFTDLRGTFEELLARLMALLEATVQEHFVMVALDGQPNGMHTGVLDNPSVWQCDTFLIGVRTDLPEGPTATQLPQLSKIASDGEINNILSAATPGAPVQVTYTPPPEIPVKAGTVYFTIDTDNSYWRNVQDRKRIAVYLPPLFDPAHTSVQLMGVPRRGRGG